MEEKAQIYSCFTCINRKSTKCNNCFTSEIMGKRVGVPTNYDDGGKGNREIAEMTRTDAINILSALRRYISVEEKAALDMAINSLKIDEMYDLEKENADEFISRSAIKELGEVLRTVQKGMKNEDVLIGFNLAVTICNKYLGKENVDESN